MCCELVNMEMKSNQDVADYRLLLLRCSPIDKWEDESIGGVAIETGTQMPKEKCVGFIEISASSSAVRWNLGFTEMVNRNIKICKALQSIYLVAFLAVLARALQQILILSSTKLLTRTWLSEQPLIRPGSKASARSAAVTWVCCSNFQATSVPSVAEK